LDQAYSSQIQSGVICVIERVNSSRFRLIRVRFSQELLCVIERVNSSWIRLIRVRFSQELFASLKGLIPVDSGSFETVLVRVNRTSLKGLISVDSGPFQSDSFVYIERVNSSRFRLIRDCFSQG
jgi:hypothetical protein